MAPAWVRPSDWGGGVEVNLEDIGDSDDEDEFSGPDGNGESGHDLDLMPDQPV